jgi:NAD(P) transhydrogenase subunit alpha
MTLAGEAALSVGAVRESGQENRVAVTPGSAVRLRAAGHEILLEHGAGQRAWFPDDEYAAVGVRLLSRAEVLERSDVVACLHPPDELARLRPGQVLVGLLQPLIDPHRMLRLAESGVTAVSFDTLPRTVSRAQSMDALTSQSSVAGYKAALVAADAYGAFFPMLTTAAGTSRPASVLVLGAGVAGLQAIATARRLGAVVTAFDVRDTAQSDIRSVGAAVLDVGVTVSTEGGYARVLSETEQAAVTDAMTAAVARFDVVITSAQVPGRPPPRLLPATALEGMRAGSVVVDGAAGELGGNVEGSRPGTTVVTDGGVTVVGAGDLAARVPQAASAAYGRNVAALLGYLTEDGKLALDLDDEVQAGLVITSGGQVVHPSVRQLLQAAS